MMFAFANRSLALFMVLGYTKINVDITTCQKGHRILNYGVVVFQKPVFKKLVRHRQIDVVAFHGDDLNRPDPRFKVLLTDFFLNDLKAFFPENFQF